MAMPEHSLMQSPTSDPTYQRKRRTKRNDLVPIPHKWFEVLSLHLSGMSTKDILELTGYSLGSYYRIMNNPRSIAVRQQLLSMYQDDFEALFTKVVDNIRDQLDSEDIRVQQVAQQQFFRAENKFKVIRKKKESESAEDMVSRLLNGNAIEQVNVQVNVSSDSKKDTKEAEPNANE
jgi:hypothetical protein